MPREENLQNAQSKVRSGRLELPGKSSQGGKLKAELREGKSLRCREMKMDLEALQAQHAA